jgi:probable biosynthetic protein (TIGR04098 family)
LKKYLQIIKNIIPSFQEQQLNISVKDVGIDSIDLVVIRVAMEKYFGLEVSDKEWYAFSTLGEALTYFHTQTDKTKIKISTAKQIILNRDEEIRMPQMANSALSENWLLKEIGDIHWQLLSTGLEQKSSEFKDDMGNRLYATFIRINYSVSPLNLFQENEIIHFTAEIKRFGNNTYLSMTDGVCNDKFIRASLMTSFSQRESSDNSKISKTNPQEKINNIEELTTTPEFLNEYRLLRKGLLNQIQANNFCFRLTDTIIVSTRYTLNPYYDINGVGLLYFASYPIIADKCLHDFVNENDAKIKPEYHTVYRDIFYFSNCNSTDQVLFKLNSMDDLEDNKLAVSCSLYRQSDNVLMAKIFTIKQLNE